MVMEGCERERGVFGLVVGRRECVCLDGLLVGCVMGVEKQLHSMLSLEDLVALER